MECLPFITPLPLLIGLPLPFPLLVEGEDLPLPFDLSLELLPFEVDVYPVWYVPGDTKLVAGSCKYDHAR
jgi:hypothetical protein